MAQRENGNNRREEYRRIRSQQSKAREGGRRQSDPDYNLEERQKYRKKSFKKAEDMQDTQKEQGLREEWYFLPSRCWPLLH